MNIEMLKQEIAEKNEVILKARDYIKQAEQQIAEHLCPFSVGDRVIAPNGEEQVIASISYEGYGCGYSFEVFKIKKNGELYKYSNNVWNYKKYRAA